MTSYHSHQAKVKDGRLAVGKWVQPAITFSS
jgi:hypothetical protein